MNIVVFESKPRDKTFFSTKTKQTKDKYTFVEETLSEENAHIYTQAEVVCISINSKINKKIIEQIPKLKLITTRSTGFDHIDLVSAKKKKIVVCNVPQYGSNTVAEHTFALILNLSRNVHKSYMRAKENNFEIDDLTGFDLQGKTLGVIGAGRIGQHVIKLAKGFGMHVIAYDEYENHFLADLLHFTYAKNVEEVLKKADIITLHAPATPATHHFINDESLKLVKKGAILINTSRGELVDTNAMYKALKKGRLGGAGLDVIEGEEYIKEDQELLLKNDPKKLKTLLENKDILKMDNVVYTPHNAFNSKEAVQRRLEITHCNILGIKTGKIINQVK